MCVCVFAQLQAQLAVANAKLAVANAKLGKSEAERRVVFNLFQELKGMRPLPQTLHLD